MGARPVATEGKMKYSKRHLTLPAEDLKPLERFRNRVGWSRQSLAERLRVNHATIWRLERRAGVAPSLALALEIEEWVEEVAEKEGISPEDPNFLCIEDLIDIP